MWNEIEKLKKFIDAHRPLQKDLMKTISQKFHEEWTYHSNAIEGNTFTYQETAFFLREGITVKGKTLREHLEVVNHLEAIHYLEDMMKSRDLSERLIKDFHAILFQGVRDIDFSPGSYKEKDNHVLTASGKIHHYCPFLKVPEEMEKLIAWYDQEIEIQHPIQVATLFHHQLVSIHPFTDGNGRVARLCMNFILMKKGYVPAIIHHNNRFEYYQALEKADQQDPFPFIELVKDEVQQSLQTIQNIIDN